MLLSVALMSRTGQKGETLRQANVSRSAPETELRSALTHAPQGIRGVIVRSWNCSNEPPSGGGLAFTRANSLLF